MQERINKVVVIGTGAVGCSYAFAMVNQGVAEEIVLIDKNEKKAEGEAMDLNHGVPFSPSSTIIRNGTYADCQNADLVVISAGLPQKPGETRLELLGKNIKVFKSIVQNLLDAGFDGIILVASNPVDILTYAAFKASGFPPERVIGSGTVLDSARFKYMLGQYLEVDARNVHAIIIGEHGDTELPVWSQASVGVESLDKVLHRRNDPNDQTVLESIFNNVRGAAYEIIARKGATYYAIGLCLTRITKAIFNNENSILPVSCYLTGQYGQSDIYMGVPAVVSRGGIREIIEIDLNETEAQQLAHSADVLRESIQSIRASVELIKK